MEKKKGGPIQKKKKAEIIEDLKNIVESGSILGLSNTELSQQLGINVRTLVKYLDEVYNSIPPEDIQHVQVKIDTMFKRLFRESEQLMRNARNDREKKEAMEFLLKCIKEFTEFLERFGLKQKAPDLHYMKGDIDSNINIQVITTNEQNE